jgi:hypothetical protein
MSQWQSLYLAVAVSIISASAAFPQASTSSLEVRSGDVWLLPGDRVSPVVVPRVLSSNGDLPTGDVWLSPDQQAVPSVTAEGFRPGDATLAHRNE